MSSICLSCDSTGRHDSTIEHFGGQSMPLARLWRPAFDTRLKSKLRSFVLTAPHERPSKGAIGTVKHERYSRIESIGRRRKYSKEPIAWTIWDIARLVSHNSSSACRSSDYLRQSAKSNLHKLLQTEYRNKDTV
jgi:hypothetical protein